MPVGYGYQWLLAAFLGDLSGYIFRIAVQGMIYRRRRPLAEQILQDFLGELCDLDGEMVLNVIGRPEWTRTIDLFRVKEAL